MSSLSITDPSLVKPSYESLFGWHLEQSGPRTLFRLPRHVGGEPEQPMPGDVVAVLERAHTAADAVWTPSSRSAGRPTTDFWVADTETAAETATTRGGQLVAEHEVTDTGFRTTVLADPGGARFTTSQRLRGDRRQG